MSRVRAIWTGARRLPLTGKLGLGMTLVLIALALLGPYLAPESTTSPVGLPYSRPSPTQPLGADALGRDVLSRVLSGGQSIVLVALVSTILALTLGTTIGMAAAWFRGAPETIVLRLVDLFLALPSLLIVGLLAIGIGRGTRAVLLATTMLLIPDLVRLVRAATLRFIREDYVDAAVARGESSWFILRRELFPNIVPILAADAGLRMLGATALAAAASFLGFGLQPPAADWALMVQENRGGFMLQPWAVVAPTLLLGLFCLGVCWLGDGYARSAAGRSDARS